MGHFKKGKWIDKPIWIINWSYAYPKKHIFETEDDAGRYIKHLAEVEKKNGVVIELESRDDYNDYVVINIRMIKLL